MSRGGEGSISAKNQVIVFFAVTIYTRLDELTLNAQCPMPHPN